METGRALSTGRSNVISPQKETLGSSRPSSAANLTGMHHQPRSGSVGQVRPQTASFGRTQSNPQIRPATANLRTLQSGIMGSSMNLG